MTLLRDCCFLVSHVSLSSVPLFLSSLLGSSLLFSCFSFDYGLFSGFQAWSRWREQLLCVQRERWQVVSAVKHHQHWQKWRSLKAWLEYLQGRRVKRQRNGEQKSRAWETEGWGHHFHSPSANGANLLRRDIIILCHKFWKKDTEEENTSSLNDI